MENGPRRGPGRANEVNRVFAIRSGFIAGIVAGGAILAASALVRMFLPVPTLAELTWDFAVGKVPGALFSVTLDVLKYAAKPLLLAGLTLHQLLIAGALGTIYALMSRLHPFLFNYSRRRPWLLGAAYGLAQMAVVVVVGASLVVRHGRNDGRHSDPSAEGEESGGGGPHHPRPFAAAQGDRSSS